MTRSMTQDEFLASAPNILSSLGDDVCVIERDGSVVAALVSAKDLQSIRAKRGQKALAAMNRLSDAIEASGATSAELEKLERALDRHLA